MNKTEFRKIITECKRVVEVHENHFKIMCNFVEINEIFTIHDVSDIRLVGDLLWFGEMNINLSDVNELYISELRE